MDIKTFLNFVKWQIKGRLPNEEFFIRAFKNPGNFTEDDISYYLYLCDIYKQNLPKYLFGSYLINEKQLENFYSFLDKYKKDNHYEFLIDNKLIRLPIPQKNDRQFFRNELFDLILPYLADYPQVSNIPFHEGPYEYNDVYLGDKDIVLDLGANVGMFSAFASAKGCKVYAFEPTKDTIARYLNITSLLNPNIEIVNMAVSDKSHIQVPFSIDTENSACNGITEISDNVFGHNEKSTTVETITIDDFVKENNLNKVDFIKADIEGAERMMLVGAKNTLKEFEPNLSICYYHCLDDYKVLRDLILDANNNYEIATRYKKIYAHSKTKTKVKSLHH